MTAGTDVTLATVAGVAAVTEVAAVTAVAGTEGCVAAADRPRGRAAATTFIAPRSMEDPVPCT